MTGRSYGLPPADTRQVRVARKLPVRMRDGTVLVGDRYFAADAPGQPVVLMRSPYGRGGGFAMTARLFAERGFQVFLQSCRGTFGSGGRFDPIRQEPDDSMDTLDWLQAQPWCTGKVHSFGMSYLGMVQWTIARQAGDRLGAMTLHNTLSNYRNEVLPSGGLSLEGVLGWGTMMAKLTSARSGLALVAAMLRKIDRTVYARLPLRELDAAAIGREVPWWRDWIDHAEPGDSWWDVIDFSRTAGDIETPAAMIAGWYDLFLPWQVRDFEAMQANGRDAWLTIGPWYHVSKQGGMEAMRQGLALSSAVASGRTPFPDRDRVRLYVVGADKWRDYPAWPPPASREQPLYLRPDGGLSATPEPGESAPTRFTYDPRDPTPDYHSPSPFTGRAKTPDMASLEVRSDTILFTGAPIGADAELIGPVSVELHVRSDREHTDFYACLCDVDAHGRSLKICDGYVRLRPDDRSEDDRGVRRVEIACAPTPGGCGAGTGCA